LGATRNLAETYGPLVERLGQAVAGNDEKAFSAALDALQGERSGEVTRELRALTDSLFDAMMKFRQEFRIPDLAEREVPDARARLNHVLKLTDEAAHRTMDLIEQCGPLADRTSRSAGLLLEKAIDVPVGLKGFLQQSTEDCNKIRGNLAEVILAQTYQDLTGQIIRGVVALVGEVEHVLAELMRLTGPYAGAEGEPAPSQADSAASGKGFGPAIPGVSTGVVQGQDDIDALMAGLGI
jgi:chemotaxis protein CheZ